MSLTGGTATFDTKAVGTAKTVTLAGATLTGADAANYTLGTVGTTTADISPLTITASFTAADKVYDATTAATVLTRVLAGAIAGDDVELNGGSATFADANAGTGKVVTLDGAALAGADKDNYTLASVASSLANINKADATIVVDGYTGTYDAAAHGATGSAKGVQAETLAGLDLGASFTNVPGGTANWSFTDTTGNYNNATGTAPIVINKATAVISVVGFSGVYDGAAHGVVSSSATGVNSEALSGL